MAYNDLRLAIGLGFLLFPWTAAGEIPDHPQHVLAVQPSAPPIARPFSLHDVRLSDGPFKTGQEIAVQYLLSLEPDRLLANFRTEAGLEPKARHYGGWESRGVSGHSGGHYLSACSLAYAATGDQRFLERVRYIVSELAACQQANGNGYVSAIPNGKRVYAEIAAGDIRSAGFDLNGCWVPNYTMHKLLAGLRDAYRLCGNRQALEVSRKLADWFERTHAGLSEEQMQQILVAEHGGLNETFADLYADTGDERYLQLSRRFHHKAILEPLAQGKDILPGKHANTQFPKIIGVAARYELTGEEHDREIADFFWDRVVHHHSYVTGGNCDQEHFGPPDQLNDRLSTMTTESCNVYNMLKLTTHIFGWNPTADVADFYERALLNHMRGTQHSDGRVIYNLSLHPGHFKEYQSLFDGFTCCVGTGMENHVKYGEAIYFHDDDGIWVNLFIASEVNWRERGVTLRQETTWPLSDRSRLTVECQQAQEEFTLRIRHPFWAGQRFAVSVNGSPQSATTDSHGYLTLRRNWKSGDAVEIDLPMSLRTESMPDNAERIAVFYGPTLLAADLGPVDDPEAAEALYVPVLVAKGRPVSDWVKPTSLAERKFRTANVGRPRDVALVPFYSLHDRRYTVYLDLYTDEQWKMREADLRAAQEREQELAKRTVDILRIGEMQPERDHNLQSENSRTGDSQGRKWRDATEGGWFSFEMLVDADTAHQLQCTYWGGETGRRVFDILIDDQKLADTEAVAEQAGRVLGNGLRHSCGTDAWQVESGCAVSVAFRCMGRRAVWLPDATSG